MFLLFVHDYSNTTVALFNDMICLEHITVSNKQASAYSIPHAAALLDRHSCALSELNFIAAYQGPGPFTTLRTIIATVNGLHFATGLPLYGIDGLSAFIAEQYESSKDLLILLNAFQDDVYYAYATDNNVEKGCLAINDLIARINTYTTNKQIKVIGNVVEKQQESLKSLIAQIDYPEKIPEFPSLEALAQNAYQQWQHAKTGDSFLKPLYLKQTSTYQKPMIP